MQKSLSGPAAAPPYYQPKSFELRSGPSVRQTRFYAGLYITFRISRGSNAMGPTSSVSNPLPRRLELLPHASASDSGGTILQTLCARKCQSTRSEYMPEKLHAL